MGNYQCCSNQIGEQQEIDSSNINQNINGKIKSSKDDEKVKKKQQEKKQQKEDGNTLNTQKISQKETPTLVKLNTVGFEDVVKQIYLNSSKQITNLLKDIKIELVKKQISLDSDNPNYVLNFAIHFMDKEDSQRILHELIDNIWNCRMESLKLKKLFFKRYNNPIVELENLELALDKPDQYNLIDYIKFYGVYDLICHRRKIPLIKNLIGLTILMELGDLKVQTKQIEIANNIICQITKLQVIQIHLKGAFSDQTMQNITDGLMKLINLDTIHLMIDFTKSTEQSFIYFIQSVRGLRGLRNLFLGSTQSEIDDIGVCKALREVTRLQNLMIFSSSFSFCPNIKNKDQIVLLIEQIQKGYEFIEFQVLRSAFLAYNIEEKKNFSIQSIIWELFME